MTSALPDGPATSLALRPLESRMHPPRPLLELVRRDRLVRQLSEGVAPLVVVSAPAGSGKTVALSQWARSDQRPFAWLQADRADNDPLVLLNYLVAALKPVVDIDPLVGLWLQLAPPPVETRILPALVAAVRGAMPFCLVIDDVHFLTNEACWQIVGLLVEQLPPRARLCLSGRRPVPLPLARLRAAGALQELGGADLAMNTRETHELLRLHGLDTDAEIVAHLERVTEGWAAGLYLAALAGIRSETAGWLAGIRGHQRDIAAYLASEVLEQQPAELAEFLLRTSILERLSPSLCRAVTGRKDAGDLLHSVAHNNLFVSALDDVGEWFRYHHFFAEFLEAELERRDGEGPALHGRAAGWFEEHDQLEEAVRHWLAAGNARRAGDIVCRAHMHHTHLARYHTIRRWLDMFTDDQILGDAALTLTAGCIGAMAGDSARSRAWIRAACRMQVGDGMWPGAPVSLRAMQAWTRSAVAPQGVGQMRADAELAAALSEGAPASEHAAVITQLGIARWLSGDIAAALRVLREGEEEGAIGNVLAQITAAGYQALILADEGRWDEARRRVTAGLRRVEEAGLSMSPPVFPVILAQCRLQAHDGDPGVAEQIALIGTFTSQSTPAPFMLLICELLVGELLLKCGELSEATRWMHAGFTRLASLPDAGILRPRLERLRDLLDQRRLLEPLTPAERRVLEFLPTELSLKQIASRLWVSHETVHTHVQDIYRKLEVHARSEAVARARDLELLSS